MNIYVETSALLAWLFHEPPANKIAKSLAEGKNILSSSLTVIEAERALLRMESSKSLKAAQVRELRNRLLATISRWQLLTISEEIEVRAREKFPIEPIRTLDAIHLATALEFLAPFPDLVVLSLDDRILNNLEPLGLLRLAIN